MRTKTLLMVVVIGCAFAAAAGLASSVYAASGIPSFTLMPAHSSSVGRGTGGVPLGDPDSNLFFQQAEILCKVALRFRRRRAA